MANRFDTAPRSFVPDRYDFSTRGCVKLNGMRICCGNCGRMFFKFYNESSLEREMMIAHIKSYHKRCKSCGVEIDWSGFDFSVSEGLS